MLRLFTPLKRNYAFAKKVSQVPMRTVHNCPNQNGRRDFTYIKSRAMAMLAGGSLAMIAIWHIAEFIKRIPKIANPIDGSPSALFKLNTRSTIQIFRESDAIYDGQGNGSEGRSHPYKFTLNFSDGTKHGYIKISQDGRVGMLNEMVFHSFANRVLDFPTPRIALIEYVLDDKHSRYALWIESIGENESLIQTAKMLNSNTNRISEIILKNLGVSMAFSRIINSNDNFLKNFVSIIMPNDEYYIYAIDFEETAEYTHELQHKFIDLTLPSAQAARLFIEQGGILEFKKLFSFSEYISCDNGGINASDIGDAKSAIGRHHLAVKDLFIQGCAQDINNNSVINFYKKVANLSDQDIQDILQPFSHIMSQPEIGNYTNRLQRIVNETREHLEKYENHIKSTKTELDVNKTPKA